MLTSFAKLLLHSFKLTLALALLPYLVSQWVCKTWSFTFKWGPWGLWYLRTRIQAWENTMSKTFLLPQNHWPIRYGIFSGIFTFAVNFTWSLRTVWTLKDLLGKRDSSKSVTLYVSNDAKPVWLYCHMYGPVRALLRERKRERKIW